MISETVDTLWLDGPVDKVLKELNSLGLKYPKHQNFRLSSTYDGIDLIGDREETDEEYTLRMELEKRQEARRLAKKEKKEKQERYLFEKLKTKYGG